MAKSLGDAMMIDLKTRIITCLTCNVPGAVFLRVTHLVAGDYILIGPDNCDVSSTPMFPFGYGLSYTSFAFGNLQITLKANVNGTIEVSVDVTNSGNARATP